MNDSGGRTCEEVDAVRSGLPFGIGSTVEHLRKYRIAGNHMAACFRNRCKKEKESVCDRSLTKRTGRPVRALSGDGPAKKISQWQTAWNPQSINEAEFEKWLRRFTLGDLVFPFLLISILITIASFRASPSRHVTDRAGFMGAHFFAVSWFENVEGDGGVGGGRRRSRIPGQGWMKSSPRSDRYLGSCCRTGGPASRIRARGGRRRTPGRGRCSWRPRAAGTSVEALPGPQDGSRSPPPAAGRGRTGGRPRRTRALSRSSWHLEKRNGYTSARRTGTGHDSARPA